MRRRSFLPATQYWERHVNTLSYTIIQTPLATAAALATTDGQVAAHRSSIAALQSLLTTGLSNKADQSAFDVLEGVVATKSTPDGVGLKLSNYSTTAAMNGSIASANNATLATVAANYGLKTVVDQHSLDMAARITPLEVDTKVANALLGAVTAAALASELASRDASISGLQASKADASALTAYALQSGVDTSSEVDSKIAAALLNAVTTAALDAALLGKADASALASLLSTVDGLDTPLEVDTKIANALLGLATGECRACAKVGILPPRSEFRLRSSTEGGFPTSLFCPKNPSPGQRRRSVTCGCH